MRKLFCSLLVHIPVLKYALYPSRIIIRKYGEPGMEIPHRYGVMPDGSEMDLGSTVDSTAEHAASLYRDALASLHKLKWLAPVRTKGSDFHPLGAKPAHAEFVHYPARTRAERRLMWPQYLECKYVPEGTIRLGRTPHAIGRQAK